MIHPKVAMNKVLLVCSRMVFFVADYRHISFFIDKHTFQNQKLTITKPDIKFQSLPVFYNVESCQDWPLEDKWPLKFVWYSTYHYVSYDYYSNRLSIKFVYANRWFYILMTKIPTSSKEGFFQKHSFLHFQHQIFWVHSIHKHDCL